MKFVTDRPYSDPERAARRFVEIANSVDAGQDRRIYIELINGPFREKGTPDEYKASLDLAIELVCSKLVISVYVGGRPAV